MGPKAAAVFVAAVLAAGPARAQAAPDPSAPPKELWITCIGASNVLGSREEIRKAVTFAKQAGIRTLFVQVYRGGKAWFHSDAADASVYRANRKAVGADPFELLIQLAHDDGIEVHAWINTLTLSQNRDAPFLKQHGESVLTKDQHRRNALLPKGDKKTGLDRFYMREDQLFLEPGDPRVQARTLAVVKELATRYPALDGIHFDYIRYPAAPPYLPGSRFNALGLTYGYGEENVRRFREKTGIDPFKVEWKAQESQAWDDWKREQVTALLREAAGAARAARPGIRISCAVISSFDRAYFAASQDWVRWLEEGIADFVVLMNYSHDPRYVKLAAKNAIGLVGDPAKIHVGLGAFLLAERPELLSRQVRETSSVRPGGLVFFDYDAVTAHPGLRALFEEKRP
jgi:uncharacterized lipoprotein YddW (UPF0748 family)